MSALQALSMNNMTLEAAQKKYKEESGRPKVEYLRFKEDGDYTVRILPICPVLGDDGKWNLDKEGYEYPYHKNLLKIEKPAVKGKKPSYQYVNIIRATDDGVGKSVDLMDEYRRMASEEGEDIKKLVNGNSYSGGLRYSYAHAMWVLSDPKGKRELMMLDLSHSQYRDLEKRKINLWNELKQDAEEGEPVPCPVTSFGAAYPVVISRGEENKKTTYTFDIGRKTDTLKDEDADKLNEAPRIPDVIFQFNRRMVEAELEFLKQYDEKHELNICESKEFKEIVAKLMGELSAEDQSHFNFSSDDNKDGSEDEKSLDSFWERLDQIKQDGVERQDQPYQELLEDVRSYVEDNDLDIRISRGKDIEDILDEIDEALKERKTDSKKSDEDDDKKQEKSKKSEDEDEDKDEKKDRSSRRSRRDDDEDDDEDKDKKESGSKKSDDEDDDEREERKSRRSRRNDDDEDDDADKGKKSDDDDEEDDKKSKKSGDDDEPEERSERRKRRR